MRYVGSLEFDVQLLLSDEIVLFGAGRCSRRIFNYLECNFISNKVVAICDNNNQRYDELFEGRKIISVKTAVELYKEADFVIAGKYVEEMLNQLLGYNIKNIHLLIAY